LAIFADLTDLAGSTDLADLWPIPPFSPIEGMAAHGWVVCAVFDRGQN
jgi:hypothetical protein